MLGRLIRKNCKNNIKTKNISELRGMRIVIDASIYIYKYKSNGELLSNIYLMCSVFKYYEMDMLFVFDGKAGEEKKDELNKRKMDRKDAKYEYYTILENNKVLTQEMLDRIDILKKKFVRITNEDINNVKILLESYGVSYVNAEMEADTLCAHLIKTGEYDVCLSDDMDLFAYGCNKIIRNIDLINHTCLYYDLNNILISLKIDMNNFRKLCIISGCDYYKSLKNIFYYYDYYIKNKDGILYDNLLNSNIITNEDYEKLNIINNIFNLSNINVNNYKITDNSNNKNDNNLKRILMLENFVFIK